MSPPTSITLRPLEAHDLPEAHALSQAVSWPHRFEDWRLMLSVGHGFAAVDETGALRGVALWWVFGDDLATLGLVIVSPQLQKSGIGRRLLAAITEAAGSRPVQLNATAEGTRLYESFGFRDVGGIVQHHGVLAPDARVVASAASIRPMRAADREAVRALDRKATGADRAVLLDALEQLSRGWVAEVDGKVRGTLLCRTFGRGQLLGPLAASDESIALALLSTAAMETGGFLRADIPDDAADLARWLEGAGLPPVGRVRTMRTKGGTLGDADARTFGLASQAWS